MRRGDDGCRALTALALLVGCGSGSADMPDATPLPAWDRGLPPSEVMAGPRDLVPARGIIHLHSPYSHDACDGEPRDEATGAVDEACLADLRAGLCATRMDYAALTDHDDTMADEEFETLLLQRGDDQLVDDVFGAPIANRVMCDDGHDVLLTVGGENPIMPFMLDHHVEGTVQERHDLYNGDDATAVAAFRAAGAVVWIPHSEQRTLAELLDLAPDGLEIYQLHANIDPDIREQYLGLDAGGAFAAVAPFADTNPGGPEPDLALLAFLERNDPSVELWDSLLQLGHRATGSGGTDAHQNALPILLRDGERGDSYRRMMRWFSNVALVEDPDDIGSIEEAIRDGRMFVAFELMGTPEGLDVHIDDGGVAVEIGGSVPAGAGATLEVTLPTVYALDPSLPTPTITARVIKVTGLGPSVVAQGAGPFSVPLDEPGAYRVEVDITPLHLAGYLGNLGPEAAERQLPWIYVSPVYVE